MLKNWWKILAVIILTFVLFAGLLVPLKPGIVSVSPSSAKGGDSIWIQAVGYNTRLTQDGSELRAWLKLDSIHVLEARQLEVQSDQRFSAFFILPSHFPDERKVHELTLVADSRLDGYFLMPSAIFVSQESVNTEAGKINWSRDKMESLSATAGIRFPYRNILYETIRNTYFHVPMWFGMILLFLFSAIQAGKYLAGRREESDMKSAALAQVGTVFGILGIITGGIWAQYTWGEFWSFDVKQNVAAISLLIYLAYFVLRGSFPDPDRRAVLSAGYNIFAFCMLIPLLFVIPRMTDSLHPGSGGNPAMGGEDLDSTMRMVFYPAVIGWTLLGAWIAQLIFRYRRLALRRVD